MKRRRFLEVSGAAGAAMAAGCNGTPLERLVPYVNQPLHIRPGMWVQYATTCRECYAGCGMYIRCRDGRAQKAEGNPDHPVSRGGLCPRGQSALQGLYDPDRIRTPLFRGTDNKLTQTDWNTSLSTVAKALSSQKKRPVLISSLQTGTLSETMKKFQNTYGGPLPLFAEPFNTYGVKQAFSTLYSLPVIPHFHLENTDYILSFGANFLETWISPIEFTFHYSNGRVRFSNPVLLHYIGPHMSMTAANADQYFPVKPEQLRWCPLAIIESMVKQGFVQADTEAVAIARSLGSTHAASRSGLPFNQIDTIALWFNNAKQPVALSGPDCAMSLPFSNDIATGTTLLNSIKNSIGTIINPATIHALSNCDDMNSIHSSLKNIGPDDILIIYNVNIAYIFPDSIEAFRRAAMVVYIGSLPDETARLSTIVLPPDYSLETWGDYEPYTGIHSLIQPAMQRLYNTLNAGDILLQLSEKAGKSLYDGQGQGTPATFYQVLFQKWRNLAEANNSTDITQFWSNIRRTGFFIHNATPASVTYYLNTNQPGIQFTTTNEQANDFQLWLWGSVLLFDGRTANRGWIQETMEPVNGAVWSAWADMNVNDATVLELAQGDHIIISNGITDITLPIRTGIEVTQGTIAVRLGQGHTSNELSIAFNIGANGFDLISHSNNFQVSIKKGSASQGIVYAIHTREQHDRDILQTIALSELTILPVSEEQIILPFPPGYKKSRDLYPPHIHAGHRWAMVIDLQRCIGCGACTIACYAENNIPVMGRTALSKGREMTWLKVIPYRLEAYPTRISWLPLPCQHCDAAPCEPVCPVYASVHNEEGLNSQIYNRCIGTRYCSNNCPYKVRRFNWFNTDWRKPLDMQLNPDVTVRCRGVMEKCTFCVQRIKNAEYNASLERRPIRNNEIQPACVQSCPAKVYTFGDLRDPKSDVSKLIMTNPRRFQVLMELNTKPAVIYLKRVIDNRTG